MCCIVRLSIASQLEMSKYAADITVCVPKTFYFDQSLTPTPLYRHTAEAIIVQKALTAWNSAKDDNLYISVYFFCEIFIVTGQNSP